MLARGFYFCYKLIQQGPLAHLVERIHGMDEVTGSSPVRSTYKEVARLFGEP